MLYLIQTFGSNTILLSWQKASRRTKTTFISAKKEKVNFPLNMGSSLAISGCLGWVSREVANPWWRLPASAAAAAAALRGSRCWKTSRLVMAAINGLMVVEFLSSISFQTFHMAIQVSVNTCFNIKLHIEKICYLTSLTR